MAGRGDRRWASTLVVVLMVALAAGVGVAGLRLAQLRSVPLAAPRALPAQGAGSTVLEVSTDAWAHSSGQVVRDLLSRHFDAINTKNYPAWVATVTAARAGQQPEPAWRQAYASTTDGTVRLSRIDELSPGRLAALVSYISAQRPEDAPEGLNLARICWRVALPLVGDPPRIDVSKPGSTLRGRCEA